MASIKSFFSGKVFLKINHIDFNNFTNEKSLFNNQKHTKVYEYADAPHIYYVLKYFFIPVLVFCILFLVSSLLLNRYKSEQLELKTKNIDARLNDFLTRLIFQETELEVIKKQIIAFKNTIPFDEKWCRFLVLNKIIHFKKNLLGIDQNRLLLIYKYFGLQQYSQDLINDRRWYFKSLGIFHYKVLDYKIKKGTIKPFLKSSNKYLRSNALIAYISLSDEKFGILDNYSEKLSRVDEMKILDIIYQKQSQVPENLTQWLQNKNNSIVLLALKLMIRYKVKPNLSQISYLLMHDDTLVRKETLLAIRELGVCEAGTLLIEYYPKENHKRNKISCLKTLGVIGNETTITFVETILPFEKDLEIKYEMVNCLYKLNASFFDNYTDNDPAENSLVQSIVLHVKNPYLT